MIHAILRSSLVVAVGALGCDAPTPVDEETTESSPGGSTGGTVPTGGGSSDSGESGESVPDGLVVESVAPGLVDPAGGSLLVIRGAGFNEDVAVRIGGVEVASEVVDEGELRLTSPPVMPGAAALVVARGEQEVVWGELEVWSPLEISGARVFDAGHGVTIGAAADTFEWQRLTASIGDDWRVRDGNTLTWLPARGRFVMVAGWNGEMVPDGFSTVGPEVYPPENTTGEVWSSADGVTWTLDLPHGHGQFERRHSHNTVLWNEELWMIGGDHHQGFYNHDVVSSADGLTWQVELGPGAMPPPWSERALQFSGVYDGKLWVGWRARGGRRGRDAGDSQ
jgi:hypothetical protein